MPKARKGKGKEAALDHDVKPYTRTGASVKTERSHSQPDTPYRNNHSPVPPKTASQPSEESSSKRRRAKKRSRRVEEGTPATFPANGHGAGPEVIGAQSEANGSASPHCITVKPEPDAHEAVRRRMFGLDTNGVTHAERPHKHDAEVKDLRRKVANMTKSEEEAAKVATELRARIAELEQTIATQQADMTRAKGEIEVKEKLIHDHGSRNDNLRDLLNCHVCMEPLDDPHTMQCGHTACRKCLHEWFRSPNAYPAADIEEIHEDDDLTYRTKTCHMCRAPVFRRPARNIIISHVVDSVGLATGGAGVQSASRGELDSMWTKIFPPEPKSWVVRDEADNVSRCPNCGCEVDYGECDQCGAHFSVAGSDVSDLSEFDYEGRVDLGNGLLLDQQLAALDGHREELEGRLGRAHRHLELRGFVDDEAEDDEDSMVEDEEDDYDAHLLRTLSAAGGVPYGYDSEESFMDPYSLEFDEDNSIVHEYMTDSDGGFSGHNALDHAAAISVSSASERGWSSPVHAAPLPPRRQGHAPAAPPSVMSDASYESSFINDDDDVEDVSDDALDAHDESTNAADRSEVEELADDGSEVDEPSIDELRRRRAARYGAPSASSRRNHSPSPRPRTTINEELSLSPSPPPRPTRRTRRRRSSPTASPAGDSSAEVHEEAPVRRARVPRRQRVIDSDSD